jgi:hypothetical protein
MSGTVIVTKFSLTTAQPASNALAQGEQAYSYISDKLWIGWDNGGVIDPIAIGGKFYTDQLKASATDFGKTIANHAIITGSDNKIDLINIDNITIDGNAITTTNTNGDLLLDPNGSGDLNVQASTNIVGNLTVSGTIDIEGQTTLASLNVEDLTNNRVVIVGIAGEIEDSANFTFDGTLLTVNGNTTTTGNSLVNGTLHVDGQSTLASLNVEDLTNDRMVFVGAGGELEDSANLTFDGLELYLNANAQITGTVNIDSQTTVASLNVEDLTDNRVVIVGPSGEIEDSANFTFNGTTLAVTGNTTTSGTGYFGGTVAIDSQTTIASLAVTDLTNNRVVISGPSGEIEDSANFTFDGTLLSVNGNTTTSGTVQIGGDTNIDAQLTVDSLNVQDLTNDRMVFVGAGGEIEDSADLTYNGATLYLNGDNHITGSLDVDTSATIATLKVEDLTDNRVVIAGIGGEIEDSANFTFNGTTLTLNGIADIDNVRINGNTISSIDNDGSLTITPNGTGVVTVDSDTALIIPMGSEGTRPSASFLGNAAIRYNTTDGRFEGVAGGAWTGLGGVVDIDEDTYITAEVGDQLGYSSLDDDTLRFIAAGTEELTVTKLGVYVTDQITTPIANITTANTGTANVGTLNVTTKLNVNVDADFNAGIDVLSGDVDITDNLNVGGNAVIDGNLTVNGTTTTIESTVTTLNDPVIKVGDGSLPAVDLIDRGVNFDYGDGTDVKTGFFGFDNATNRFSFKPDVTKVAGVDDEDYDAPWGDAQFSNLFLRGTLETGATGNLVVKDNTITTKTGDLTVTPAGGNTTITGTVQITTDLTVNGNVTFDNDVPVTSGGTGLSSFTPDAIMISNGSGTAVHFIDMAGVSNPEDYIIKFNSSGVPVASNIIDGGTF